MKALSLYIYVCALVLRCSELVLLKDIEEVFDFEDAVFGHICAVHSVAHSIQTELSSKVNKQLG